MKFNLSDDYWHLQRTIQYYLILSCTFIFFEATLANTAKDNLEFAKKLLITGKYNDAVPNIHESISTDKNYASAECAKVIETNPDAKRASNVLNESNDEYMLNPCKSNTWFVIELCESIKATHIKIANYELFSSTLKDFTVYFSDVYPAIAWKIVGKFTATDLRVLQRFDLEPMEGFGKFVKVEVHSHYGNEHFCPISELKVYGNSMAEEYEINENKIEGNYMDNNQPKFAPRKLRRKISALRVYRTMMVEPNICGLIEETKAIAIIDPRKNIPGPGKKPLANIILPQPTQQPAVNRSAAPQLKGSIFRELDNKVKALETIMKTQLEAIERKTEAKFDKLNREFRSLALIVIAYYVYKVMLDLM